MDPAMTGQLATDARCPTCGAVRLGGAAFCESCGSQFATATTESMSLPTSADTAGTVGPEDVAAPVTAAPGEESPLDVGWTGVDVAGATTEGTATPAAGEAVGAVCAHCGEGHYLDGYCDTCGAKEPDPRDHFAEQPAPWVAGVCDIGRRHRRNEDGMALHALAAPASYAGLVVCDGVSNSTDSHVASLAAARAARDVLAAPLAHGVGTRAALVAAASARLDDAADAAQAAVVAVTQALRQQDPPGTPEGQGLADNPPSCTFVAAVVAGSPSSPTLVVVGNIGDSRAYWLPDDPDSPARQLSQDDSFAAEQMNAGVPRKEAETGPGAHAITRWLGVDNSPLAEGTPELAPHVVDVDIDEPGWLLVCSDGLWNYASDASDLRAVLRDQLTTHAPAWTDVDEADPGVTMLELTAFLAESLVGFANERGGSDNITAAVARLGGLPAAAAPAPTPTGEDLP